MYSSRSREMLSRLRRGYDFLERGQSIVVQVAKTSVSKGDYEAAANSNQHWFGASERADCIDFLKRAYYHKAALSPRNLFEIPQTEGDLPLTRGGFILNEIPFRARLLGGGQRATKIDPTRPQHHVVRNVARTR